MTSASARVHPSSVIEEGAIIGENVTIGPFCHIGPNVVLGDDCQILSHVAISGSTVLGKGCRVFPGAMLGFEPQNLAYKGEETRLEIGEGCTIREGVTMHPGMPNAGGLTSVGKNCLFLAYSHVAHDCHVGDNVVLSNNVMLAGHVTVGDRVIIGGGAAVHQFARIGHRAFIGGLSAVNFDVIPYGMLNGNPGVLGGLNIIGMQRAGMDKASIHEVRRAFRHIFQGPGSVRQNAGEARALYTSNETVGQIIDFIEAQSERALSSPARAHR
ncbi:acyl-ACP--UDP-N-acetylglucosamine O-acyltransferase [Rhizobium sp. EC-SD404]|uniref:acyl-ACP--UDP-N-acetylglucosamine O-acyltransferase n=1 Tax=Rhizobium sp. EC-SD404 TaxID=2038389 RepID=UPI001254518C|nr:acyl-ACP--UDP-N-acetylglucosamine O-acyltransferase [Rhizobium sp. EC-SD404]VVT18945.1 UDP-N-acetylglucosamine acetyltransferase [Rhizobium sp. EC-SD404]